MLVAEGRKFRAWALGPAVNPFSSDLAKTHPKRTNAGLVDHLLGFLPGS